MTAPPLAHLLRGPFNFFRPEPEELRRLVPGGGEILPAPQRIFLEDEHSTPFWGYPILQTQDFARLKKALKDYLEQEELAQVAVLKRAKTDAKVYNEVWERYRLLLSRAIENVTLSSYGRAYPAIFWLLHSGEVAQWLKGTPKRILRADLELGKAEGDRLRYKIYDRYQDRLLSTTYDLVNRVAMDTEEVEGELFPRLLRWMFDNVLVFTEDRVSHNLEELDSYFKGSLGIDGREFRRRREALIAWTTFLLGHDGEARSAVSSLLEASPEEPAAELVNRRGFITYLSRRPDYDAANLLPPEQVVLWESLLVKLKEFELLGALRRLAMPVHPRDGLLWGETTRATGGATGHEERLSAATRPLDFMAPWVVDPVVDRYGLVYDITDFSALISSLRLTGQAVQDRSFRMMFRFQRRVNRLADSYRMKLEKYLGDGAFYSSRHPRELLLCAVRLQRYYVQALEDGFTFDRGMRVALNYGSYRLIPLRAGMGEADRYEFFGHGVVELTRLTTGKASREIDEIKTMLVTQGYPEATVHRFFAPLMDKNVDTVDRREEGRRFFAYLNSNGHLVNEGIVATEQYVEQLDRELGIVQLKRGFYQGRGYVVLELLDGAESDFRVGLRRLGLAQLKGLDQLAVYEVVDGLEFDPASLEPLRSPSLVTALDRENATSWTG